MTNKVCTALLTVLLLSSGAAMAQWNYDIEREADDYDAALCVANYRNYCVDQICQVSEERDCQDQCFSGAVAKCDVQDRLLNSNYYW